MVDAVSADDLVIHHFSIGSRASRTMFALPCRMILVYHNITPPEYFLGVHDYLVRQCFHGRRELTAYRTRVDLALGDSEFNRQELAAVGFDPTAVLPVVPDFDHVDVEPDEPASWTTYDDDWTNMLFVGPARPEQAAGQPHPVLPRVQDALRSARAAHHRRRLWRLRDVSRRSCTSSSRGWAFATSSSPGRSATRNSPRSTTSRICFSAPASTRGSACRSSSPSTGRAGARLRRHRRARDDGRRRRVVRHARSAAPWRALMNGVLSSRDGRASILEAQDAALRRLLAKDFGAMAVGFVEQVLGSARRSRAAVTFDFWRQYALANELEAIRETRPAAFHALPPEPDAGGPRG